MGVILFRIVIIYFHLRIEIIRIDEKADILLKIQKREW